MDSPISSELGSLEHPESLVWLCIPQCFLRNDFTRPVWQLFWIKAVTGTIRCWLLLLRGSRRVPTHATSYLRRFGASRTSKYWYEVRTAWTSKTQRHGPATYCLMALVHGWRGVTLANWHSLLQVNRASFMTTHRYWLIMIQSLLTLSMRPIASISHPESVPHLLSLCHGVPSFHHGCTRVRGGRLVHEAPNIRCPGELWMLGKSASD